MTEHTLEAEARTADLAASHLFTRLVERQDREGLLDLMALAFLDGAQYGVEISLKQSLKAISEDLRHA